MNALSRLVAVCVTLAVSVSPLSAQATLDQFVGLYTSQGGDFTLRFVLYPSSDPGRLAGKLKAPDRIFDLVGAIDGFAVRVVSTDNEIFFRMPVGRGDVFTANIEGEPKPWTFRREVLDLLGEFSGEFGKLRVRRSATGAFRGVLTQGTQPVELIGLRQGLQVELQRDGTALTVAYSFEDDAYFVMGSEGAFVADYRPAAIVEAEEAAERARIEAERRAAFVADSLERARAEAARQRAIADSIARVEAYYADMEAKARSGDVQAQWRLAVDYEVGRQGGRVRPELAIPWYERVVAGGPPRMQREALNSLGNLHWTGEGTATDEAAAFRYWTRSAEMGNSGAQTNLGLVYRTGGGGQPADSVLAYFWYRLAVAQGQGGAARRYYGELREAFTAAQWKEVSDRRDEDPARRPGTIVSHSQSASAEQEYMRKVLEELEDDWDDQERLFHVALNTLRPGESRDATYLLPPGMRLEIAVRCDDDCDKVRAVLTGPDGEVIRDDDGGRMKLRLETPDEILAYTLNVTMAECDTRVCGYGYAVYRR